MSTSPQSSIASPVVLRTLRRRVLEASLAHPPNLSGLRDAERGQNVFREIRGAVEFAGFCALEHNDPDGAFAGDARLLEHVLPSLETAARDFRDTGTVAGGDQNTAYFTLVPATEALRATAGLVDAKRHERLVAQCAELFDNGWKHINGTLEYLNPRGLEGVAGLGLHALTGDERYKQRAEECLAGIMARQYPCGAQPYNTGSWVWGRRPAQNYQLLTATMMTRMAQQLDRPDVIDYVRRLLEFVKTTSSRRGEIFVTPYEGLHKSRSSAAVSWAWPVAAATGFDDLSVAAYQSWLGPLIAPPAGAGDEALRFTPGTSAPNFRNALFNAAMLGVRALPQAQPFVPARGVRAMPDISTFVAHEPEIDLCATLLTGYSAFAQGEVGHVRLYAVMPELLDQPTFRNAGTDAQREDWTQPTEQIECRADDDSATLCGRVYTKWDIPEAEQVDKTQDRRNVHSRELEVTMHWQNGELVLSYHTTRNNHEKPVSTRMLFLLAARPDDASAHLRIGDSVDERLPSAGSGETYCHEGAPGPVRFSAPDGSALEIVAESGAVERIMAERPAFQEVPRVKGGKPDNQLKSIVKQANEGCVRLTFEGPAVLDEARFRICFAPAGASAS